MSLDIWQVLAMLTKFIIYGGLFTSVGLIFNLIIFKEALAPIRTRLLKQVRLFALVAFVAQLIRFDLRGAALIGEITGLIDTEILGMIWESSVGRAVEMRLVGMALLIVGTLFARGTFLSFIGALVAIWSFYFIGHVPEYDDLFLQLLLFAHLLVAAFWIGVLSPLKMLASQKNTFEQASNLGHLFGKIATFAVPALIGAGIVMTYYLLGDIESVLFSTYGRFLLLKVIIVGVLLTLAALNKLRFIPKMLNGDTIGAAYLIKAIKWEMLAFAAIFLITAILTTLLSLPES